MASNRETMSGNERYKAKRDQSYDMMRNTSGASFDAQPGPVPVEGAGGLAGSKEDQKKAKNDPLVEQLKGINDTTPPKRKDM